MDSYRNTNYKGNTGPVAVPRIVGAYCSAGPALVNDNQSVASAGFTWVNHINIGGSGAIEWVASGNKVRAIASGVFEVAWGIGVHKQSAGAVTFLGCGGNLRRNTSQLDFDWHYADFGVAIDRDVTHKAKGKRTITMSPGDVLDIRATIDHPTNLTANFEEGEASTYIEVKYIGPLTS